MSHLRSALALLTVCATAQAPPPDPERTVEGQTLRSARHPAMEIEVARELRHLGAQRFVLYGVADAEQHFFAETGADGAVRRLLWVQFEGYLPDNDRRYDYSRSARTEIAGLEFRADARVNGAAAAATPARPGSDGQKMREFVAAKGLKLPAESMYQRLVYLTDESRRHELMFIYLEDLAPLGVRAAELSGDEIRWKQVKAGLLERAKAAVRLRPAR